MSSRTKLKLDWCTHEAAKYACEKWHYSKCVPKFKQLWIGVWEEERFIGVVAFGRSSTPYLGTAYGLTTFQCAELTRVALTSHKNQVSRIMAIATKMAAKQSPGMRLFVSLADPRQGHHGGIYQATGWVYVGRSSACTQYFYRDKWRNDSSLMRAIQKKPSLKDTLPKRKIEGKHKYLMPLDDDMRKKLEELRKPYPKQCVVSIDSGTPGFQPGRGGASPTTTLS